MQGLNNLPRKIYISWVLELFSFRNAASLPRIFLGILLETLSLGLFLFGENFHIEWVFRTPVNGTGTFSAFTAAHGMSASAHEM